MENHICHSRNRDHLSLRQEKLEARIKEIGSKAVCCSEREVAILSAAIEELVQNKNVNPLKELMVIQVATVSVDFLHPLKKLFYILSCYVSFQDLGLLVASYVNSDSKQ